MRFKKFFDFLIPILVGILVAAVLKNYVFVNIKVPTGSMEPTIMTGDMLLGSRTTYKSSKPERGDIVTFYSPEDNKTVYVKRIIGLPGETVKLVAGKVYINESENPLSEEYIVSENNSTEDFGPYIIPDKCYFVLGDNRNDSYDSRYWETTYYVPEENITAKVMFRYYSAEKLEFDKIN